MTILDLHINGTLSYLMRNGFISPSILTYVEYYNEFIKLRSEGNNFRKSIDILSTKYGVSQTTIKKGIRLIKTSL